MMIVLFSVHEKALKWDMLDLLRIYTKPKGHVLYYIYKYIISLILRLCIRVGRVYTLLFVNLAIERDRSAQLSCTVHVQCTSL